MGFYFLIEFSVNILVDGMDVLGGWVDGVDGRCDLFIK